MSEETEFLTESREEINGDVVVETESGTEPEEFSAELQSEETPEDTKEITPKKSERVSLTLVDPTTVDVDDPFNGRHFPPEPAEIASKVRSIREKGQLQPVRIRKATAAEKKVNGKEWKLLFGYIRTRALIVLHSENPNWRLKAEVVKDVNPQDAFLQNIEENRNRKSTNPIDDSYNISRLMNDFGWDSKRVAAFYHWSSSQVSIIRRLKGLDERIQRKVASGIMPPAEAVKLLKLAPEKVQEVVEAIPEIEEPIIDFDPESIPLDDSGSNESLQPATKPKRTEEEIKEDKKKTEKAYQSSRESNKKAAKTAVKAATKSSGAKSSRTLAELNAAIKGREDRASKAILRFMSEEWNELELNTELDDIEDALANTVDA